MNTYQPIPLKHLYIMISLLIINISIAFITNLPISIGIASSILYIIVIATQYGYPLRDLFTLIKSSFLTVKNVLWMLIIISMTLPLWMASGTLPTLVHYSFIYLSQFNVPLSAFLISTLLSLMLGTYIGTLSIVAPLFMSLAMGLNIPLPIVAGALISGAVIGDRLSPVSSNFHLICASCGSDLNKTIRTLLKSNGPAFILSAIAYYYFGHTYILSEVGRNNINQALTLLSNHFTIHPLLSGPIVLLLLMIMSKKISVSKAFSITFMISLATYLFLGLPVNGLLDIIIDGFHPVDGTVHRLISGSGFISMIPVPIIILLSAYLNDLLKHTSLITEALIHYTGQIKSQRKLYFKTGILSIIVTIISCNQSLTAIITGNNFKDWFHRFKLDTSYLARTIADTGSIVITIIPWNLNALVAASITGVSTLAYAPFTFYVYLPLIFTFLMPYFIESRIPDDSKAL